MSGIGTGSTALGASPRPWRLTGWQWTWVVLILAGVGLTIGGYSLLNWPPASMRWPAFFATDPATGTLALPATGSDLFQTFVLKSWLDDKIPYVPLLVIPYLTFLVIVPLVVPLLNVAVGSFRRFLSVGLALIVSMIVLGGAYYLFPSTVLRDVDPDGQLPGRILSEVWANDAPFNTFPSWPCAWATIGILALWRLRHRLPVTSWLLVVWLCLVFPATVMIRQNYLVDVYAGVLAGFAIYWACMFLVERPRLVPSREGPLVKGWRQADNGIDGEFDTLATEAVNPGPWGDEGVLRTPPPAVVAAVVAQEWAPRPVAAPASEPETVEIPPVVAADVAAGPELAEPALVLPFVPVARDAVVAEPAVPEPVAAPSAPAGVRAEAVAAYNRCWELLDIPDRTSEQDGELLTAAFTSRERWTVVGDPQSSIIAEWMVSRAAAATGKPDVSIQYARRALVALGRGISPHGCGPASTRGSRGPTPPAATDLAARSGSRVPVAHLPRSPTPRIAS